MTLTNPVEQMSFGIERIISVSVTKYRLVFVVDFVLSQ